MAGALTDSIGLTGAGGSIGFSTTSTLAVLAEWLPGAERRGVRLVTARSLVRVEGCAAVVAVAAAGGGC